MVARELTKIHEEFVSGTPTELLARFSSPHGEFTILVPPDESAKNGLKSAESVSDADVVELFGQITKCNDFKSKKDAARATAERLGMTAKQVYAIIERNK